MLKNAIIVTLRLIKRDLSYTVIKMAGLMLGITSVLISLIYAKYELSYDSLYPDSDRIFRICREIEDGTVASTAFPLVPTLAEDYPEFQYSRFFKDRSKTLFKFQDQAFYEEGMIWADEQFLEIFQMPGFVGNPATALSNPFSLVVTHDMTIKYFGNVPRLGDRLDFQWNGQYYPLTITGIIPEWPKNMHIQFDALVSFKTGEQVFPGGITNGWNMNYCYSYVKLPHAVSPRKHEAQFESFFDKHIQDGNKSYKEYLGSLQPIQEIHTDTSVISGYTQVVNPIYPRLAVAIGLLVLVITSINYMTLTVVQFQNRTKELHVRQAVGARRQQVVFQLALETTLMIGLSLLVSLPLTYFALDKINQLLSTHLAIDILWSSSMLVFIAIILFSLILFAGIFPPIVFTRTTISSLHGNTGFSGRSMFRKGLLLFQFLIAATLVSFTITLQNQVSFVTNQDPGYNKEQVIYAPFARKIRYSPEQFKSKALSHGSVEAVSLSFYKPTDDLGLTLPIRANGAEPLTLNATSIDHDFFQTFGIEVIEGRNFEDTQSDNQNAFILNQAAVKVLGLEHPLEAILETEYNTGQPSNPREKRKGQVIGVVEDVHFESMHNPIKPTVFLIKPYWYYYISCRLAPVGIEAGIQHVVESWESLFPDKPFEYEFLDDEFERQYLKETRLARGLMIMALLAIVTTCLGLFSYVRFITQQKTKEVGIRKTLGADWGHISHTITKDFLPTIFIAIVLAAPISYFISSRWLEGFAFHVQMTIWPGIFTFLILLLLVIVTVGRELKRAIDLNPTTALRYE